MKHRDGYQDECLYRSCHACCFFTEDSFSIFRYQRLRYVFGARSFNRAIMHAKMPKMERMPSQRICQTMAKPRVKQPKAHIHCERSIFRHMDVFIFFLASYARASSPKKHPDHALRESPQNYKKEAAKKWTTREFCHSKDLLLCLVFFPVSEAHIICKS